MHLDKKWKYILSLVVFSNSINLLFLVVAFAGIATKRPLIVYDYLLIPFLIIFRVPRIITTIFFLVVLLLDILNHLAFTFMFSVAEFIMNMKFYFLFDFSAIHYILLVVFIVLTVSFYLSLKYLTPPPELRRSAIITAIVMIASIYVYETINGRTALVRKPIIEISSANLAVSHLRNVTLVIRDLTTSAQRPSPLPDPSLTFKTFAADTTGNQLLVLVESWGMPEDTVIRNQMNELILTKSTAAGWQITTGSTGFKGSTVDAELRELLSVSGDYHYLLNRDSAKNLESIFYLKRQQGYSTQALHSFSNMMFERAIWWRNINIDSIYFLESVAQEDPNLKDRLDYYSPFPSLRDEEAFSFLSSKKSSNKKFAYFLTVNTHLPFASVLNENEIVLNTGEQVSDEAKFQLNRIMQIVAFIVNESAKGDWDKILVMGDHMPPFADAKNRAFYSQTHVPYFILTK